MGLSGRTVLGATAATAAVLAGLAMGAIGAFTGWGLLLVVLVGGGVLGGTVTVVAAGIAAANGSGRRVGGGAPLDPVTGLPSTETLEADLGTAMGGATEGAPSTLYVLALQGLQRYDEAYGKACGDALLTWLGRNLRGAVRGHGTAYRLRGANFAVLAGADEHGELQARVRTTLTESMRAAAGRAKFDPEVVRKLQEKFQTSRPLPARQLAPTPS